MPVQTPVKGQDECLCRVWTLMRCWFWLVEACAALPSDGDVLLETPSAASPTAVGSRAEAGASSGTGTRALSPGAANFFCRFGQSS